MDKLVLAAADVLKNDQFKGRLNAYFAVPAFFLYYLTSKFPFGNFLSQHLDSEATGATTGFLVPEMAKSCGASGSLINHSEHRIPYDQVSDLVAKLRSLGMISVVCAIDDKEVESFAKLSPDFIAIEPPELIGSGKAVSKARPEIIVDARRALEKSRRPASETKLLCGAGIVSSEDARLAIELGSEGILVASGVVKAHDWKEKILALSLGLSAARDRK